MLVNLLSASSSYRTLVHHYSLPLAVVAVVACIDGLRRQPQSQRGFPWMLCWATACWLALAKPWFFTGPYLTRLPQLQEIREAQALIQPKNAVLTTSYLVPQLSQRTNIGFPKTKLSTLPATAVWNVLLLNPNDPGWGSTQKVQESLLIQAKDRNWSCQSWPSGLELCQAPGAAKQQRRHGNAPSGNRPTP